MPRPKGKDLTLIDIRIEEWIRNAIDDLSETAGRSKSEIVRDLIWVGIDIQRNGGINPEGPLGVNRKLATLSFGTKTSRIAFRLEDDLLVEVDRTFIGNRRESLRTAIRLGFFILRPEDARFVGPFKGLARPLIKGTAQEMSDSRSQKALKRLQGRYFE